jgi:type IV pilus assembly protein PilX
MLSKLKSPKCRGKTLRHQSGVVLVVSLIILVLLTIIGLAGMQSTSLEEKMAGNMRAKNQAFQAAEGALQAGEIYVQILSGKQPDGSLDCPVTDMDDGLVNSATEPAIDIGSGSVWSGKDWCAVDPDDSGNCSTNTHQPRFVVQCLAEQGVYRITAYAKGATPDAVVVLQSVYNLGLNAS